MESSLRVELQELLESISLAAPGALTGERLQDDSAAAAAVQAVLRGTGGGDDSQADGAAAAYFAALRKRVAAALADGCPAAVQAVKNAGVHCLCSFVQHNITGPGAGVAPAPLWSAPGASAKAAAALGKDSADEDER
ncbi:hypothetical protein MNEG_3290 [Monoraphidium neglectum]|uniref:Uncharacterized protein n=1 Tax=Monoraphidium neglectum TaxID=145388 RepID=A0A0D2NIE4_9CHLO|nr:hypothetical protein MNEG_3290 [Monoraphidium neglectum]KIZ04676.1 hypothetical protein MNEG_3290 [Monoraphidium neglectum]|eukprot:XP_013903695.1 hypothetical protein MNEG_3290 [Monoraphidium neglectum]